MSRAWAGPLARLPVAAACIVAGIACMPALARAQEATPDPSATPQPGATIRDPDFGVVARHFGLERQVEMFQWRARGTGYERAWSSDALDSSAFAPGHDNPLLPLRSRRWTAKAVSVDGRPLDPAVLSALGRWTPFRPSFNALPGNLAATFQPQGDGLGTAENPMAPEIGDLRIHWRELRLPPLADRIELRAGRWVLRPGVSAAAAAAQAAPAAAGADATEADDDRHRWLAGLLLLAAAGSMLLARRRQGKRDGGRERGRDDRS